MSNNDEILVAVKSSTFEFDGHPVRVIKKETTARRGHPIVRGREHLFGPFAITFDTEPVAASTPTQTPS